MDLVDAILKDIEDATVLYERKLSSAMIMHFRIEQCAQALRLVDPDVSQAVSQIARDIADDLDSPWIDFMSHVDDVRARVAKLRRREEVAAPPKLSLVKTPEPWAEPASPERGLPLRSKSKKPRAVLDAAAPWPAEEVFEEEPAATLPEDPVDLPPSPSLDGRRRL